jgi:hypothetical protein
MRKRIGMFLLAGGAVLALSSALPAQTGQQSGSMKPAAPAAASAPAPEHDLSGVWNMHSTPAQRKYTGSTYTAEPPDMTAWGNEKYMANKPSNGPRTHSLKDTDDPVLKQCLPPGTPRIYLQPFPFQIVQTPKEILMIFEYDHTVRQIFMDGRSHPEDITPTYMGNSIGKWDANNTLVVDTVGFNDKTWLDRDGHPHSDQLHVTERFHRVDRDNMTIDITMEDPKALAKPWTTQLNFQYKPDWDVMELVCTDNGAFENFEK